MIEIPNDVLKVVFSNKRNDTYIKANINKIKLKNDYVFQVALFTDKQVFHNNIKETELSDNINSIMNDFFYQCEIFTPEFIYAFRITSKGKLLNNRRRNTTTIDIKEHNKEKKYLISDGTIVPPLIDLGIFTKDGFVVKKNYDKYKQINRFLEIVNDVIQDEKELNIIDFGCGKSYLTFILYYYLVCVKQMKVTITGLDLKADVIAECNAIRDKYGYENLNFLIGDIAKYQPTRSIDMIITLHACDTATDYALYHAIRLKTKYILSVPCCQHQINLQLTNEKDDLVNQYGILKERYAAILTDAIRGNILKFYGYDVAIMEFIDMVHSPKNLLIRAVLSKETGNPKYLKQVEDILNEYHISQELFSLIKKST